MVTMVATAPTDTDERTDRPVAFAAAQAEVRRLSDALAALPRDYAAAVKRGDAGAMRAARVARIDYEEQLLVARIVAVRAELALLDAEIAGLAPREQQAAKVVTETYAATKIAQAKLEELIGQNARAQGDAVVIRGQREDLVGHRHDVHEKLKLLTSATMPE